MKKRVPRRPKKSAYSGEKPQTAPPPNPQTPEGIINGDPMQAAAWHLATRAAGFYTPSLRIPAATAISGMHAAGETAKKSPESSEKKTAANPRRKKQNRAKKLKRGKNDAVL